MEYLYNEKLPIAENWWTAMWNNTNEETKTWRECWIKKIAEDFIL